MTFATLAILVVLTRNSLVNGEWGNEEREGKNPFEKGVGFDLEIKNEEFAYQVRANFSAKISKDFYCESFVELCSSAYNHFPQ
ncbi:unnamed protein product [Cylicostephanus goldi]|uniref:Galectin n=1 Tax=Cylicostephanus goldi TaxID=71465 RepID=A0A3P6R4H0_CYLGO|nr:unnamed protein product [Cylicostephanus goldi]